MRLVQDPDYPPPVETLIEVPDREGYTSQVRARLAEVAASLPSLGTAVAEGSELDVRAVATRLHRRLLAGESSDARMEWERMLVEASTGADFTGFYQDASLDRLAALAILEDVLHSDALRDLLPGRRYFFGHPVPG